MQEKPKINKNTQSILSLKLKLKRDGHAKTGGHNHAACYFNIKKEEEIKECTHQPAINKPPKSISPVTAQKQS